MLEELQSWFKEGLNFIEETILPMATLALEFVPGVPPLVPAILQKMPELISTAEKMFPGDGKGGIKQDYFMKTAELVAADVAGISTGGQAETWKEIMPKIDPILTLAISAINKFKPAAIDAGAGENNAIGDGIPTGLSAVPGN
jgi:hypothetical protein